MKPGEKCSISVETWPNSTVSLLGVDQAVTLLGSGNDITEDRVKSDMSAYNAHNSYPELKIQGNIYDRYVDLGGYNAFIITNALEGNFTCVDVRSEGINQVINDDDDSGLEETPIASDDPERPRIRKNFPETWIFQDFLSDEMGKKSFSLQAPDTISSFIVSGFAIHPENGLGIAMKQKVTVVQEFFIKLYLPYMIRYGEVLRIDVSVFHYIKNQKDAVRADVTMQNRFAQFEFIEPKMVNGMCNTQGSTVREKTKQVEIKKNSGTKVNFYIRSLVTGQIKIKIRASTTTHGDEIEKTLAVEDEGVVRSRNFPIVLELKNNTGSHVFDVIILEDAIDRSINIEASVAGDALGSTLRNINSLV